MPETVYLLRVQGKLSASQIDQLLKLWRHVTEDTPVTIELVPEAPTTQWAYGPWPWAGKA